MIQNNQPEILDAVQKTLQNCLGEIIFVKNLDLAYIAATKSFAEMMGKSSVEEILGKTDHDILQNQELANRYTTDDQKLLRSGKNLLNYVEPLNDKNGEARYSSTSKYILTDSSQNPVAILGISKDITKEFQAQQQYQKEIELLFTLPHNAYAAVLFDITDWRIIGERRQAIHNYTTQLFETIDVFLSTARAGAKEEAEFFYEEFSQEFLTSLHEEGQKDFSFEYYRKLGNQNSHWIREEYTFLSNPLDGNLNLMLLIRDIDKEKQSIFQKRQEETQLNYNIQVLDHSHAPSYISDIETYQLLHMTKAAMDLYGLKDARDYLGQPCHKIIMDSDSPCSFCPNRQLVDGQEYVWEHYNEYLKKWFEKRSTRIQVDGRSCHLMVSHDITNQKEELSLLSGRLSMEEILLRCVHTLTSEEDMNTAVTQFLTAIGGYYRASRAYIIEFDLKNQVLNNTFEWCREGTTAEIHRLQRIPLNVVDDWVQKFESTGEFTISSLDRDLNPDSEDYRILQAQGIQSLIAVPLFQNDTIVGFIGVDDPELHRNDLSLLSSVSKFVQGELDRRRMMEYISYTDTLTGLKNRNYYDRTLKEYDHRTPDSLGIVFVDINGMKNINSTYGTSYGDYIIRKTGQIIKQTLSGSAFRTNGDEFVILTENISREDFELEIMNLRKEFDLERECNVSIGCAWRTQEENTRSLLLQAEEMKLAEKKAYYHNILQEGHDTGYTSVSSEVAKEIQEGRFTVYYQPQVDLKTGKIIGAESLVRKTGEDGSIVPPSKFIPLYEVEGVIGLVDLFVMDQACSSIRKWRDQGYHLQLAVNFSRVTLLDPGIVEKMIQTCNRHQVPTSAITVEVTESISKMDQKQLTELMETIRNAGFSLSLDDFGSQFSNLSILSAMDFDELKFDRSLVMTLEENKKSQVVMEHSIQMCHNLKHTHSLAEGIETEGQLKLLQDYQCNYGQGYYFSKPLPPKEFESLLVHSLALQPN